jgi:hypothetical protein
VTERISGRDKEGVDTVEDIDKELTRHSPNRLLGNFSKGYLWIGILVTVVVHVVVIGGTSMGYIRDTWIDPEAAAKRKALAAEEKKRIEDKASADAKILAAGTNVAPKVAGASTNAAAVSNTVAPAKTPAPANTGGIPSDLTNSPIVKATTAVATKDEMPNLEKESGVPLDDAAVR